MVSLFEEMDGTYTLGADGMYYPNLELLEEEMPRYGKYSRMHHTYLREHKQDPRTVQTKALIKQTLLALVIGPLIELPMLSMIFGILKKWNAE